MHNYTSTVREIYDLQKFAIKLGLDNIRALCAELGDPQKAYPVIHLAGTNGKGSTAFFLARILQSAGLKTALFTSPHLSDFRERIRVNGRKISRGSVIRFWERMRASVLQRKATFFDTTTALALDWFRQMKVDVAVIETGLGGRLDSTNIVEAGYTVLTPIHFDHQKQLGDNLRQIAAEKAGIIKKHSAVFSAVQKAEALETIRQYLKKEHRFFYLADHISWERKTVSWSGQRFDLFDHLHRLEYHDLKTRQLGGFQLANIALAYLTARMFLKEHRILFNEAAFRSMLARAVWPGRMQVVARQPNIVLDVSHNPEGIEKTLKAVNELCPPEKLVLLTGLVDDKNYVDVARIVKRAAGGIVVTEPATHRRLAATDLAAAFQNAGKKVKIIQDLHRAFEFCKQSLKQDETLLVIGSHYLVGPLLENIN
ncbi:MAG TPA: bifunctional folylpolyglutamate synthase/dihydrofolate synthase [Caldithrix abyssi]|uniref:Dihydrofolate synthase/folylpolyglutamate synthase n=1 Tax=Caldithrix abyssi TaxID=187145 RepID=A0A7V4U1U4_CALAY|nr:bifunctional folylpolyglutamate synthase/dihydrofolate synthase [Caldithrix abyssi]